MTSSLARSSAPGILDGGGNPMSGGAAAVARYDEAIDRLVRFHPAAVDILTEMFAEDVPIPMASAMVAYLHLMGTDPDDLETARAAHTALVSAGGNEREQGHADAIGAWIAGDWHGAARRLDDVLMQWPSDVGALMFGHQLDFFVGDALNLRDRPLRSLREIDPAHPHAPFMRGMASFGLEEAGHYGQALDAGLAAIDANPDDVWAVHAVVHTYEMQGLVDEGITFLGSDRTQWESGNLFTVHNWWHLALYELERGNVDRALKIYDAEVHNAESEAIVIEMLDASALLWRLYLDGADTGDRFAPLADAWAPKAQAEPWYAFNDLHAVMAFVGANREDDAREVIARLEGWLDSTAISGSNVTMTADVGLPACRAALAFAEDRHDDVVAELLPIRRTLNRFGGSHAQRDALQRTLLESALRSGRFELARALTSERLAVRENSPYSWAQPAAALGGLDDAAGADAAADRAASERARLQRTS